MSTQFGDDVEEIVSMFGDSSFFVFEVSYFLAGEDTLNKDQKIRYHLNRLGFISEMVGSSSIYWKDKQGD